MIDKVKTLIWYLRKPRYYGHLFNLLKRVFSTEDRDITRNEAVAWCNTIAISTSELLFKLGITEVVDFEIQFKKDYDAGLELVNNAPIKMGGPGNLTLLYHLVKESNCERVIETGVAYGWSSLAILKAMEFSNNSLLISTDLPYAKMNNEDFVGMVVPKHLKDKWDLIRLPDVSGLPKALNRFNSIDLCHYDSDKSYEGRMWAYPKLWKALRSGGYLVSDDISDNIAFKEFSNNIETVPYVVKMPHQYVGVLIKP